MVDKKKTTDNFDGRIWPNILEFNVNLDAQLTSKANFIFGASTLILVFILNKLLTLEFSSLRLNVKVAWLILVVCSFISSLLSIMVVLPKLRMFSKKERLGKDIFYYKNITMFYSRKKYSEYLKDLPLDNKKISEAYSNQIYSLAKNIIPYKFRMLKISGWVLITGIIFSTIMILLSLINI